MIKRIFGKKLSRSRKAKLALFRGLTKTLCLYGQITTTKAKAKAFIPFFRKQVELSGREGISPRRKVLANLGNDDASADFIHSLVSKDKKKNGFLKVIPLAPRRGDAAEMTKLELVGWTKKELPVKVAKEKLSPKKGKRQTKKADLSKNKVKSVTKESKSKK